MRPKKEGNYFIVNAASNIRSLNRMMGWNIPIEEAKTMNGAILEKLGYIPDNGTEIELGDYKINIVQTKENAIKTLKIKEVDSEYRLKAI